MAVVEYSQAPQMTLEVRPLSASPILRVEFLLFGYDKMEMSSPNGMGPEHQGSYIFAIPKSFTSESYECGPGKYISEVRITQISGAQAAQTFEICFDQRLTTYIRDDVRSLWPSRGNARRLGVAGGGSRHLHSSWMRFGPTCGQRRAPSRPN